MSRFWNERTRRLTPYVPGEQPKDRTYIKLNTNELPYPPSPKAIRAMAEAVNGDLRLYPDPEAERLKEAIARHYGVRPEEVFVGNGSDEILAMSFLAFYDPGEPLAFPEITYSFYKVYAGLFGIPYRLLPLDERFRIRMEEDGAFEGGLIVPNPNAPTGIAVGTDEIRNWLERCPSRVCLIDEAYIDFGGQSAVPLIRDYPQLLVVQTFSKSRGLAGMRVGFAIGQRELIEGLNRVKHSFNSYTLDRVALAGAEAAIVDGEYFEDVRRRIIRTRERISGELARRGFELTESMANFLFASHPRFPAAELFQGLRRKGILVRYFNQPKIDNHLRITIGTDEEMDELLKALDELTGWN
jgi:histidinol-phosphate aminotransferase